MFYEGILLICVFIRLIVIQYILFQHGNDHSITIEKEMKKQKNASKNQLSILDEINKQVTQ